MPHSYGASLADEGRRGARRRDMPKLTMPNTTARIISTTMGRYWLMGLPRDASPCWYGGGAAVGDQDALTTVEDPAQREEDETAADGQHERRLTAGAEVADHVHVLVGPR